jgi:hypothetical protein
MRSVWFLLVVFVVSAALSTVVVGQETVTLKPEIVRELDRLSQELKEIAPRLADGNPTVAVEAQLQVLAASYYIMGMLKGAGATTDEMVPLPRPMAHAPSPKGSFKAAAESPRPEPKGSCEKLGKDLEALTRKAKSDRETIKPSDIGRTVDHAVGCAASIISVVRPIAIGKPGRP